MAGSLENKANSAQALLELGLRLSLATLEFMLQTDKHTDRGVYRVALKLEMSLMKTDNL